MIKKMTNNVNNSSLHTLIRIPVRFTNFSSQALLDTGAAASFISANLFSNFNSKQVTHVESPKLSHSFKTASGTILYPLGYYTIAVTLDSKFVLQHPFFILPNLEEGCILGIDFITTHNIKIDPTNKVLTITTNNKKKKISYRQNTYPILGIGKQSINKINLSHLDGQEKTLIENVLDKYCDIFAENMNELGRTNVVKHRIETHGEPVTLHPYRTPVTLRPLVQQHIQEMLDHGIIRPSSSPYRSPVVMVKKKTGDLRFCVDYRKLNSMTVKDRYPLPRIDDTLDYLHGSRYFSTIDLFSGYWQIEIADSDKFKTAFTSEFGHFEFNRMPFGLCNAPSTFQRLMENILRPLIGKFVLVYIDDVIVYSKNLEDHAKNLEETFGFLQKAGLKIKLSKCSFATEKVNYLGHVVSKDGVAPDPGKLSAVDKFPAPKNADQVRSFLGLASYYRRFIENFAEKAHAMSMLTRKTVAWQWGPAEQSAFDCVKKCLVTSPVLGYPDFTRAFIVHTDASGYGIGAVLSQMQSKLVNPRPTEESPDDSNEETVIAYTSRHLSDSQIKWSTTEKEAFAIIHSVKTFYHYLYGTKFTIVTDHRPLEYLMSKKDPTGRLARWSLFLQQFDITIKYRPGKANQNADCLSRIPVNLIVPLNFVIADWIEAQNADPFCQEVLKQTTVEPVQLDSGRVITKEDDFVKIPSGLLSTASGKIVVPAKLQQEIIGRYHDHKMSGHLGIDKTLANVRAKYFWPRMVKHVRTYVNNCLTCAKRKAVGACKAPLQPIPIAEYIWQRIAMDIMGPLPESFKGNKYILVIMEYTTRYVLALPLKEISAKTVMRKFIKHIVNREGIPSEILTDQGSNFQSQSMKELCKQLGIKQLRTTAYHPQTDGAVEKFNRTLGDMLTAHVTNDPAQWDEHLDYCVAHYNRTPHSSTGETPFYLLKGRDALEPTDLRPPMRNRLLEDESNIFSQQWHDAVELAKCHLIISQSRQKHYYDVGTKICSYEPNDLILLKEMRPQTGKFYMRWKGPYVVVEKISQLNYLVRKQDENFTSIVHVNRMKMWKEGNESEDQPSNEISNEMPSGNVDNDNEKTTDQTPTDALPTAFPTENNLESENSEHSDVEEKVVDIEASQANVEVQKRKRGRPKKTQQTMIPNKEQDKENNLEKQSDAATRTSSRRKIRMPSRYL